MRIISARSCGCSDADMFLPEIVFVAPILESRASKRNTGETPCGFVSSPCRAILFVLRLDGLARLGPVVVAPVAELVEVAAHREPLRAVHCDGLAIDPVAAAGDQEHRQ